MALSFPSSPPLITVRVAEERDYRAIAQIQAASPESAQWPLGDYSSTPVLIALHGATPVGFCAWRQSAPDEAELLNLAVRPEDRRMGVASALLSALETHALGPLFLEVSEHNVPAIALYLRHGWQQIAVRKGYYNHGKTGAIVMKKTSC